MIYDKLILVGYKRIALNLIDRLEIDFNKPNVILLGCNGSGKTSVATELVKLWGHHQDFKSNGYKAVHLRLNGSKYIVEADFSEKHPHKFIKDGVNLNSGGTITAQMELVRMHMGIDSDMINILLGKLTLTNMPVGKRKDILMRMSGQPLDYALSLYDACSTKSRDLKGALSHLKGRIFEVSKKVDTISEEVDMDRIDRMQKEIIFASELMGNSVGVNDDFYTFRDNCLDILAKMDEVAKELMSKQVKSEQIRYILRKEISGDLELDDKISSYTSRNHHLSETATNLMYEQDQITRDIIEKNQHGDALQVKKWKEESLKLSSDITALTGAVRRFKFESLPSDTPTPQAVRDELLEALSNIPDNTSGEFSRSRLNEIRNELLGYESRKLSVTQRLRRAESALETLREVKSTKCPKCSFVYKEGVTEGEIYSLEESIISDKKTLESIVKEEDRLKDLALKIEDYAHSLSSLIQLKGSFPIGNLIDELITDNGFNHSPSTSNPIAMTWVHDYELAIAIRDKTDELERLNYKLNIAESYVDKAMGDLTSKSRSLEDKAMEIQSSIVECREKLDLLCTLRSLHRVEDKLHDTLLVLNRQLRENLDTSIEVSRTQHLRTAVRLNNIELSSYKTKVEERNSAISILEDMQSQVSKVEEDFNTFKLLTSMLSPAGGIIARTVGGFLHHMCNQMNETISGVFTYDLRVTVSEQNLLDYKFPIASSLMDNPPKDVSECSDGQKEIIDFAFKQVAMRQLGFGGFPLILDEPGRTMDEEHQKKLMNYIKMLMDSHRHSQCIFISHFAFASGVFKDASYIVLNPSNITTPGNYNVDVKIS